MKRVRTAGVAAAACLLLAGCGQAGPEPTRPQQAPPSAAQPSMAPPSPARPSTPPPSTAPPGAARPSTTPANPRPSLITREPGRTFGPAQPVTVSGTVQEGVEAGCLVLNGFLVIGGRDQGVRAGAKVTVTGRTEPSMMTTCQQGTPLLVESVRPG